MGPNGSGKSTLARAISGHPEYEVTGGEVIFDGKDLLDMDPDERAREGVFMAFQYPVEIAGVNNAYFLKAALNAKRKHQGLPELDAMEFMQLIKEKSKLLDINQNMLSRAVNEGFSGGEKKRNEIFQMALLEPKLAVLDETDSGLDIDALKVVADGRQRDARTRTLHHRRDALPAPARLHRAGFRARAERRPHREVRRQGAGARTRAAAVTAGLTRRRPEVDTMTQVVEKMQPRLAALGQRPTEGPRWLAGCPRQRGGTFRGARIPDRARRRLAVHQCCRRLPRPNGRRRRRRCRPGTPESRRVLYADAPNRLVFLNGRFSPSLSRTANLPDGVKAGSLAGETDPAIQDHFGRLAETDTRAFAALNTAFAADGAYVSVPDGVVLDAPIHLLLRVDGPGRRRA